MIESRIDNQSVDAQQQYGQLWMQFRAEHEALFGVFSRMTVAYVLGRNRGGEDDGTAKRATTLTDLIERRHGLGREQVSSRGLSDELGITSSGVNSLMQGVLGYISRETGLPFKIPIGINARQHVDQIASKVRRQLTLEERLKNGSLPVIEEAAIKMYLSGFRLEDLALHLNANLNLKPPIAESTVASMLEHVLGLTDRRMLTYLPSRALQAREVLSAAERGEYRHRKAEATITALELLSDGCSKVEIMEEMGLRDIDYLRLINEAFIELQEDDLGREEMVEIYRLVSREPFVPLATATKNLASRFLLEPYRDFRLRLELAHLQLSPRERAILEATSEGITRRGLAELFNLDPQYVKAVSRWLFGETGFVSFKERLEERRRILGKVQDDVMGANLIPDRLTDLSGFPAIVILEQLADGLSYQQVAEKIAKQIGLSISPNHVLYFYAKIRGYYRENN